MKRENAELIEEINVTDPDTGGIVPVCLYKDQASGAIFGIDSSFLEQEVGEISINDNIVIPSPFNKDMELELFDE